MSLSKTDSFLFLVSLFPVSVQPAGVPEAGATLLPSCQSPGPASQPEGEPPPPIQTIHISTQLGGLGPNPPDHYVPEIVALWNTG